MNNKVSIVIPAYFVNKNLFTMTKNLIGQLLNSLGEKEIIVVDDGSPDIKYKDLLLKLYPGITVLYNEENKGFAKTVNKGIRAAKNDLIILLNNDITVKNPAWIKVMLNGIKKYDMIAPAGGRMTQDWEYIPGEVVKEGEDFSYLVGWCLMVKKEVFNEIGLIPEDFLKGFFEDALFSYRAKKAGFKLSVIENIGLEHLYHSTFKAENIDLAKEYQEKRKIFLEVLKKEQ